MLGLGMDIVTLVRVSRLNWYGHVMRRDVGDGIRRVLEFEAEGVAGRGRPRKGWRKEVEQDMKGAGLRCDDALKRDTWRKKVWMWGVSSFNLNRKTPTPDVREKGV